MDDYRDYIEANKRSWGLIAAEHYQAFKARLEAQETTLSRTQIDELGDLCGKRLIHVQCNTGADSISLRRMGAIVTGTDIVPENIAYARRLAHKFGMDDMHFMEANTLEIMDQHHEQYDVVYTTEGVLCWLPDLKLWARNMRHLLADDGFLYVLDSHPFFMIWDEKKLPEELAIKYPYFQKKADQDGWIGGYASPGVPAVNYSWMYTLGEIVTALSEAGLHIEWLHEFDWLFYEVSKKQVRDAHGNWVFPEHQERLPYTFSLKATVR